MLPGTGGVIRFGPFELDGEGGRLLRNGVLVRLRPQPFRLLQLLASRPGQLVTRDEIRDVLWGTDTFVDFEQGVNAAVRQIRDALNDDADRPVFVETVPRRGYRFVAPVESPQRPPSPAVDIRRTDLNLHKALWLNIAEIRMNEVRRRKRRQILLISLCVLLLILGVAAVLR